LPVLVISAVLVAVVAIIVVVIATKLIIVAVVVPGMPLPGPCDSGFPRNPRFERLSSQPVGLCAGLLVGDLRGVAQELTPRVNGTDELSPLAQRARADRRRRARFSGGIGSRKSIPENVGITPRDDNTAKARLCGRTRKRAPESSHCACIVKTLHRREAHDTVI
jgi:hypothetical protein